MSYEKVKTIKIKDGKVFINGASNNLRPLNYTREEYPYFTKILQEEGKEAVEIALLRNYEEGNLQDGVNKYSKALKVLIYVFQEEYKRFNWRNHNSEYGSEERKEEEELRKSLEFKELLKRALNYPFPKNKFIITKYNSGEKVYGKKCLTCMKWSRFKEKVTKYDFREEAEDNIFKDYKGIWEVEELN